ncbi:MAG TPA: tRNA (adenosine(37)-N6)-dimethylallyltransferase MiaA [Flavobacteriaceae bacterium]|nr:tRNA (adenosine(37)-N6)-dimethylallyltransferase MiaA [Flavobacteriaceae bacterium]
MNKYLISVVGPTGIGKTALSIKLAQHFNTEIISADSRQFYKEMQIGTAAPTKTELEQAKHHFIHHISIEDQYSVGDFERDAIALLDKLFKKYQTIVMVGGSGLFVNAVTNGLDNFPDVDAAVRKQLNDDLENKGLPYLQEQLKVLDEESYKTIAIDNPRRVIRALEISIGTGKPYASFLKKKETNRHFKTITIGLNAEREIIYSRINKRVDLMVQEGLLDEVKQLLPKQTLNALNTVGYKELFEYFNGNIVLDEAIEEIKKNSRRYAKRQLTWFKKQPGILWFDYNTDFSEIASAIQANIETHETS